MTTPELREKIDHLEKHIAYGEQFEEESDLVYEMNQINRKILADLKRQLRERGE